MVADEGLREPLLPKHSAWTHRISGSTWRVTLDANAPGEIPAIWSGSISKISPWGDLVESAVRDIVDAAGGLEYSRIQLERAISAAQDEFAESQKLDPEIGAGGGAWNGQSVQPVYYEFYNCVAWTVAVKERYIDRLYPTVKHDITLWAALQNRWNVGDVQFEDARLLARCGLLRSQSPPYTFWGARMTRGGPLIFHIPTITNLDDCQANLGNSPSEDRHVVSLVAGFWAAITQVVDGLLDVLYGPSHGKYGQQ